MSLYNLDDLAAKAVQCPSCGMTPMGEGCYHICPNSVHYYSAEQERLDEPFYGDDDQRDDRHGAYAEYLDSLESDIPVDVEDFAPQAANWTFEDDLPF